MLSPDHIEPALQRWFGARLAADSAVEIEGPERIAVGHSRAMLLVAVRYRRAGRARRDEYVLRVEQGGVFGSASSREVRLMRILRTQGLPVAPVRWFERDPSVLGAPFFVMDRIEGRGENPELGSIRECIRLLRRQHDLDWRRLGLDFLGAPGSLRSATLAQIGHWEGLYRESRFLPVPLLEEAAEWLRRHAPIPSRSVLVHGDPGPGNYMYEGDRVLAITDWEFAHIGDADEDWVYLATIRGAGRPPEQWRELFREEAGVEVSEEAWHYWDVFNQFKGACANLTALLAFVRGTNRTPNMAAVGSSIHLLMLGRLAELIAKG